MSRGWGNLVLAMPWQRWFWPLEMNARSLWKECGLKEAEFCKCVIKHKLPALVRSRASASPVEVGRIVGMLDMPETARNMEKAKSEPVYCLCDHFWCLGQQHGNLTGWSHNCRMPGRRWLTQLTSGSPSCPSAQPAGSWNPKVLLVASYELEGKRISSLCPRAILSNLANAAGQDNPCGHCPYSPWSSTGNSAAPSALKQLANSGFY